MRAGQFRPWPSLIEWAVQSVRAILLADFKRARIAVECSRFASTLPHRITAHLDAMSVMDQPIEDAIRQRGIADLFVPTRNWQLGRQDCGTHLVPVFADLPEVATLGL
jgi:hypothetical protein